MTREPVVTIAIPQRAGYMRHLAPVVHDVQWVDAVTGCATADFVVDDPAATAAITQDCKVVISDPRSGDVLWTGQVARDGVQSSPLGDSATVRCVGDTDAAYSTRHWSLPYIIRDYAEWGRETIRYPSHIHWDTDASTRPTTPLVDALVIRTRKGANCYPGYGGRMQFTGHMGTDMWLGAVTMMVDHGTGQHPYVANGAPSRLRTHLEFGDIFYGKRSSLDWDTTTVELTRVAGSSGSWPAAPSPITQPPRDVTNDNYLILSTEFTDSAGVEVTNENVWMAAHGVIVAGSRVDEFGVPYPVPQQSGATMRESIGQVLAGEIVKDLVGRCLRGVVDPARIDVRMDTWRLTQADYREPTTPGEIMDDLTLVHPDHLWRLGRRDPITGLSSLSWRLWETTPRYVVDGDRVEVDLDGSPDPLYNSVTIRWADWRGRPRSDTFTADPDVYPDIADLRGIREAPIVDLDASLGRWEIVERIGQMMLDQVARRIPAGTVTVTGPVLDTVTQVMVPPSQIEAATTCAITTDEPMVTHRIHEVSHAGVDEATLSIGRPRLSLDQIVATRGRRRR